MVFCYSDQLNVLGMREPDFGDKGPWKSLVDKVQDGEWCGANGDGGANCGNNDGPVSPTGQGS